MKFNYTLSILAILFLANCSFAQDVSGSKDHEIINRYPGSEIKFYYKKEYSELDLATALKDALPAKLISAKGKHTSILYAAPSGISPLEIFRNYESAINKSNGEILFSCKGKYAPNGCDDYSQYYSLKFFEANYYKKRYNNTDQYLLVNGSDDQAFLVAKFEDEESVFYVEIGIDGDSFNDRAGIQLEIVEEKKMTDGLITAKMFDEAMDKDGKIALYGVQFETGKSTLKSDSQKELDLVVDYLKKNPSVNVYIVGHTDDTGNLEGNLSLSKNRAKSVVQYLISKGINSSRLIAEGVGPFAPVSNNQTEKGKKRNRRVEVVKQLKK